MTKIQTEEIEKSVKSFKIGDFFLIEGDLHQMIGGRNGNNAAIIKCSTGKLHNNTFTVNDLQNISLEEIYAHIGDHKIYPVKKVNIQYVRA